MPKHTFQTEVSQLLHLIIHSLYSHKEIFLRELISNSSDALDKLKHLTLTDKIFKSLEFDPQINISFKDGKNKTLRIEDSGIGMNKNELLENDMNDSIAHIKQFIYLFGSTQTLYEGECLLNPSYEQIVFD